MIMARTKKMTAKYWNTLSEGSKRRALTYCFPIHKAIVDMLLPLNPAKRDGHSDWWQIVFKKVRIPEDNRFYKTVVNKTYLA